MAYRSEAPVRISQNMLKFSCSYLNLVCQNAQWMSSALNNSTPVLSYLGPLLVFPPLTGGSGVKGRSSPEKAMIISSEEHLTWTEPGTYPMFHCPLSFLSFSHRMVLNCLHFHQHSHQITKPIFSTFWPYYLSPGIVFSNLSMYKDHLEDSLKDSFWALSRFWFGRSRIRLRWSRDHSLQTTPKVLQ